MNGTTSAIAPKSLEICIDCEAEIRRIENSIKSCHIELNKLSIQKSPYRTEQLQRRNSLDLQLEDLRSLLQQLKTMSKFDVGVWVRNGTPTPGQVKGLYLVDSYPRVAVLYDGTEEVRQERPAQLTIVDDNYLEYIWSGEKHPKLVRRGDQKPCNDLKILEDNFISFASIREDGEGTEDINSQIVYCKKQYQKITRDRFPEGTTVKVDTGDIGIVCPYSERSLDSLQKVEVKLPNEETEKFYPTVIEICPQVTDFKELEKLELTIKQGLQVFYEVGEALAKIRDRKLYKQLNYHDFQTYLKERWQMGKTQAYRLINSVEVVKNISSEKSVPHGGQKLPTSERVARELGKVSPDKQAEAWAEAIRVSKKEDPTTSEVKAVVDEIKNCPDKTNNVQTDSTDKAIKGGNKAFVDQLKVGQIVRISSDRTDKRLIGHNSGKAVITNKHITSVDLKLFDISFSNVSANDIELIEEDLLTICLSVNQADLSILIQAFERKEDIVKAAIEVRSLAIER